MSRLTASTTISSIKQNKVEKINNRKVIIDSPTTFKSTMLTPHGRDPSQERAN
jgi:hypothetical protein